MFRAVLYCVVTLLIAPFKVMASGYGAIVIDANTGDIIHEDSADVKTQPASLTKMMTLYLVFKAIESRKIKWNDRIVISKYASNQMPSKLGVKPGATITVNQAVLALITKSANDAATALAEHLGGSESSFAELMNSQAAKLGMKDTVFQNASGVPNPRQITTPRDMVRLSLALIKHFPSYYRLFGTKAFHFNGAVHKNHNHLLGCSNGMVVDGIKTGFVNASGFNLCASATCEGRRLIAVVLGGSSSCWRDSRVAHLLRCGFSSSEPEQFKVYKQSVVRKNNRKIFGRHSFVTNNSSKSAKRCKRIKKRLSKFQRV